jgi:hypothetical protein
MKTKVELLKKIAQLEFFQDQMEAELNEIDGLLVKVGFPEGLKSAKEIAKELLENEN